MNKLNFDAVINFVNNLPFFQTTTNFLRGKVDDIVSSNLVKNAISSPIVQGLKEKATPLVSSPYTFPVAAALGFIGIALLIRDYRNHPLRYPLVGRSTVHLLKKACDSRNPPEDLRKLLQKGVNIHATDRDDPKQNKAIHWACSFGNTQAARILLERRADPNSENGDGETPLHLACLWCSPEFVRELIEHHPVKIEARDSKGATPLNRVAEGGFEHNLQVLIEKGADVNAARKDGTTPLQAACLRSSQSPTRERSDVVDRLLSHPKLEINAVNHNGQTVLDLVPENSSLARKLISYGALRSQDLK